MSLQELTRLGELIEEIQVAMVTTVEADGTLHSRPVSTLKYEPDGLLWFFTAIDSAKAQELREDIRVSVAYAHPAKNIYVAVAGSGALLRDRAKAHELWTPFARAFFPDGVDDTRLALLRIRIERAEYWQGGGTAAQLYAIAKAAISGKPVEMRDNQKLTLSGTSAFGRSSIAVGETCRPRKHL